MADWLSTHKNLFVSNPKEPHFFADKVHVGKQRNQRHVERERHAGGDAVVLGAGWDIDHQRANEHSEVLIRLPARRP